MIAIKETNSALEVTSPYNEDFIAELKQSISNRRFDRESRAWIVPLDSRDVIEGLLSKHYGWQPETDLVTVKLIAKKDLFEERGSIRCAGYPIARAFGRDSGARVCENVVLVSGVITSGGSTKNWHTRVNDGTVFRVKLPKSSIKSIETAWKYEIIEEKTQKEKLVEERARLVARIAEIDRALERS